MNPHLRFITIVLTSFICFCVDTLIELDAYENHYASENILNILNNIETHDEDLCTVVVSSSDRFKAAALILLNPFIILYLQIYMSHGMTNPTK